VTRRGQAWGHRELACATCHQCYPSRHWSTSSGTLLRSSAVSPLSTLPPTTRPNFALPQAVGGRLQAAIGKHRVMSLSRMLRRAPRVARRGATSVFRMSQPRPMTMVAMVRKWAAAAWCALRLPQIVASTRRGHKQTTSSGSSRRPAQITYTPSSTSSGTVA
jgi:hypothetical protein